MELIFLGTGSAWGVPEHSCSCLICEEMNRRCEERTRSSLFIEGPERILIDCGPDFRSQIRKNNIQKPDIVLITHGHGDHFLGLDDLLAYKRSLPTDNWTPIPVFASVETWEAIEKRFDYLIGSLIEKRTIEHGVRIEGPVTDIIPVRTDHGPTAPGSVGYCLEINSGLTRTKLVYTSDFISMDDTLECLQNPDILVIQAHWLNEPAFNRPYHMSFQNAIPFIKKWRPVGSTYLIHISDSDHVPGDPANNYMKKSEPLSPLRAPDSNEPYPIPLNQSDWENLAERIRRDYTIESEILISYDGLRVKI